MSTDSMLGAAAPAAARAAAPAAAPSGGTWNVSVEIPLAPASVGLYMGLYDALSPAAANEDRSGGGKDRSGGGIKRPRYTTQLRDAQANNDPGLVQAIKVKMQKAELAKNMKKKQEEMLMAAFEKNDVDRAMEVYGIHTMGESSKKTNGKGKSIEVPTMDMGESSKETNGKGKSIEVPTMDIAESSKKHQNNGRSKASHEEVQKAYNTGLGEGYQRATHDAALVMKKMEKELLEKIAKLEDEVSKCSICLVNPPNAVFTECGHVMCEGCAKKINFDKCPSCRGAVHGYLVFHPT